jgi:hypothetical protein
MIAFSVRAGIHTLAGFKGIVFFADVAQVQYPDMAAILNLVSGYQLTMGRHMRRFLSISGAIRLPDIRIWWPS